MNDPMPAIRSILGMPGVAPIDHKAEAEEILTERGTVNDPNGLALAHATLYLAEQQRISNLIALEALTGDPSYRYEIRKGLERK